MPAVQQRGGTGLFVTLSQQFGAGPWQAAEAQGQLDPPPEEEGQEELTLELNELDEREELVRPPPMDELCPPQRQKP